MAYHVDPIQQTTQVAIIAQIALPHFTVESGNELASVAAGGNSGNVIASHQCFENMAAGKSIRAGYQDGC